MLELRGRAWLFAGGRAAADDCCVTMKSMASLDNLEATDGDDVDKARKKY